jgi:hypothetical protein
VLQQSALTRQYSYTFELNIGGRRVISVPKRCSNAPYIKQFNCLSCVLCAGAIIHSRNRRLFAALAICRVCANTPPPIVIVHCWKIVTEMAHLPLSGAIISVSSNLSFPSLLCRFGRYPLASVFSSGNGKCTC